MCILVCMGRVKIQVQLDGTGWTACLGPITGEVHWRAAGQLFVQVPAKQETKILCTGQNVYLMLEAFMLYILVYISHLFSSLSASERKRMMSLVPLVFMGILSGFV